jgi:hypothetical protein
VLSLARNRAVFPTCNIQTVRALSKVQRCTVVCMTILSELQHCAAAVHCSRIVTLLQYHMPSFWFCAC